MVKSNNANPVPSQKLRENVKMSAILTMPHIKTLRMVEALKRFRGSTLIWVMNATNRVIGREAIFL
jgi:hypothetical protein